jgi:ketosteroid isomerase-like protein
MSAEQNKALVRRFFEAHEGKADLDALDQMLAPDFVSHVRRLPGQQPDREGYKWSIAEFAAAFSDRRFLVQQQVAEGDTVVTRFIVRATHDRKEFLGVAPTGREAAYKAARFVSAKPRCSHTLHYCWPSLPRTIQQTPHIGGGAGYRAPARK